VQLLRDVLRERHRSDVRRFDLGEIEQVGHRQLVGREDSADYADVDEDGLEEPPSDIRLGAKPDSTSGADVRIAHALDVELEVVVELERRGLDKSVGGVVERGGPVDVHVTCRAGLAGEAELHGEAALQNPSLGSLSARAVRAGV